MLQLLRGAIALIGPTLTAGTVLGQAIGYEIPDDLSCPSCVVVVNQTRVLHLPHDTTDGSPASVRVDPRGHFWIFRRDDVPLVFDSLGKLVATIGARGLGLGQYVGAYAAFFLQGDSTLILDSRAGRATMLDPSFRAVRYIDVTVPLHSPIVRVWPNSIFGSGSLPSPESAGLPLHEVTFNGSTARLLRSFGPGDGSLRPASVLSMWHKLGSSSEGGFWSASVNQYEFYRWREDGTLDAVFGRSPKWFAAVSPFNYDWRRDPPQPFVAAISEDSPGRLRVLVHVAGKNWRDGYVAIPKDAVELPEYQMRLSKLRGSYIEFIDSSDRRVIARRHLDAYVIALLPGDRLAIYEEDESPRRFRVVIATAVVANR